jgi:hypothetical protein
MSAHSMTAAGMEFFRITLTLSVRVMHMVALCTPHHFHITHLTPLQLNTTMTVEDDLTEIGIGL